MEMIEKLKGLGIDADDAMKRFMNNEALYVKMLGKLPKAVGEQKVLNLMESGDYEGALASAHTLKGVMGNLSVTPLYRAYDKIVQLLRAGKNSEAKAAVEEISTLQSEIIACIEQS
jgi:HPt (histidine-containing phosphotransfer) domain-containing protein